MKEKGFTLIEILGTLVILGVLMLLISPLVLQSIKRFRNDSYESQVRAIEVAATDFATDYLVLIPLNDGQTVSVTVGDLKADGYLDKKLKNPKTDKLFPNDAIVTITKKKNNYTVKFDESSGTESLNSDLSNENAPVITLTGEKIMQILKDSGYVEPGYVGSVSGVKVTYKKGKSTVSKEELKKEGIYTIYYELTHNGITQVITRTVIVGEYS